MKIILKVLNMDYVQDNRFFCKMHSNYKYSCKNIEIHTVSNNNNKYLREETASVNENQFLHANKR